VTTASSIEPDHRPPIVAGQVIGGRYLVGTLIGQGGMGLVCAATHLGLESPVAIKVIRSDLRGDAEFVERFLNEARRAAALKGEHIAGVHDVGVLDTGEPYLVMERLEGVELEAYLRSVGPLEPKRAAELALQVCEGLEEAHAAGIVHRDLKPANLFLTRRSDGKEVLKILDFGISKAVADEAPSSLTSRPLGSPWYMSPEQMLDASSVDFRADIWSLGVVLFEFLTKTQPFDGKSITEVCAKVLTAPPPLPSTIRKDLDPDLEAIVIRCLQKERDDRYPDVRALALDLQTFLSRCSGERESVRQRPFPDYDSLAPSTDDDLLVAADRRSARARTIGMFGILATVVLAAGAFGGSLLKEAKGVSSSALQWRAALAAGPEVLPLDKGSEPLTPWVIIPAPRASAVAPASPEPVVAASEATPSAPMSVAPPTAAPVSVGPPPPATWNLENQTSSAPALSQAEIERRKVRYETWLREQGLERLDQTSEDTSTEPSSDSPY
jgi:eukaryotic-like serine/threonine-protein kinase